jgi:hypothetical protein
MTNQMREIELGIEGLRYVRVSLEGGKEFSKYLLEVLDLESGKLSTFLPSGLTFEQVNQFSYGGKFPQPPDEKHTTVRLWNAQLKAVPTPSMNGVLISVIEAHLKSGSNALCIFENALASPGDPWLKGTEIQTVTSESSVYHFLTPERLDRDLIELTVKGAKSIRPPLIGVLARFPTPTGFHSEGSLDLAELCMIAGQTEKLIVGAYDGEGYLIWSKSA